MLQSSPFFHPYFPCLSPVLKDFTMKESASSLCLKIIPWKKVPLLLVKNFHIHIPSPAGNLIIQAFKIILLRASMVYSFLFRPLSVKVQDTILQTEIWSKLFLDICMTTLLQNVFLVRELGLKNLMLSDSFFSIVIN